MYYNAAMPNFQISKLSKKAKYYYRQYDRALCRSQRLQQQRIFLRECLKEQLIPKSMNITLKWDFTPFHDVKKHIILDRIRTIKFEEEKAHMLVRRYYQSLSYYVNPVIRQILNERAHYFARKSGFRTRNHLIQKFHRLQSESVWHKYTHVHNVINQSDKPLSQTELSVLGLGLSFNLQPTSRDVISTAASFDNFLFRNRTKITNPEFLRGAISPLLSEIQNEAPLLPNSMRNALYNLQRDNSIKIMPADKGGKVVVMNTSEYNEKIRSILSDSNTYEHLVSDPRIPHNKMVRERITNIARGCPDPDFLKRFLSVNASLAYIYGIPKIHKPGCPLRPIISNVGTITRNLAGWLASILTPYLGKFSGSHLINSLDLKDKLTNFNDHSTSLVKLVSLDIVSLFTNVPTQDVINFIGRKIDSGDIVVPIPKHSFIELIELCVNNNVFQFQNEFYRQKFGISMGSPLSPVLANLYMEYFESELLPSITPQPILWYRYVDDIIALWPNDKDFDAFFDQVNNLAPSIKFTTEWEVEGSMPFLDTRIHRSSAGFHFSIYRKPTHSNQYIHWFSWHSESVKRSSLFSLFLRAYRICDSPYLEPEINFIYNAFENSGFPRHIIDSVHRGVKSKFFKPRPTIIDEPSEQPPTISLPYGKFSNNHASRLFRSYNCRVVNKANNTIRSMLIKNHPPRNDDPKQASGVYEIPCKDCDKVYFGQTGRPFNVRINEHMKDFQHKRINNACFAHHRSTGHQIDFSNWRIIHRSNNHYERLVVESTLINSFPNFNKCQSTLSIDNHSAKTILKSLPYFRQGVT